MGIFYKKPFALCCFFIIIGAVSVVFLPRFSPIIFCILFLAFALSFPVSLIKKNINIFRFVALPVLLALLSAVYFQWYFSLVSERIDRYNDGEIHNVEAVVLSQRFVSNYSSIYEIKTTSVDEEEINLKMRYCVPYNLGLNVGDRIDFCGYLTDFETVNGFDQKQYYNSRGFYFLAEGEGDFPKISGNVTTVECFFLNLRNELTNIFEKRMDEESAGIVNAIFLGDRDGLSDSAKRDFKRTGGYHLLALSGMHLSVFTAIINAVLELVGMRKGRRFLVLSVFIIVYVSLTGFCLSMVRSAIMLLATYIAFYFRRRRDIMSSLMFAAAAIIIFSPSSIKDVGFWMSVCATFGVIIAIPFDTYVKFKLRRVSKRFLLKFQRYVISTLIISFSATLMVLPFSCYCFGALSLVGPILTLVLSNVVSLILLLAPVLLITWKIPFVSSIIVFILEIISRFILDFSEELSKMDHIYVSLNYDFVTFFIVPFFLFFGVLMMVKIKRKLLIPVFVLIWASVFGVFEYKAINDPSLYFQYVHLGKNEYICLSRNGENTLIDISDGSKGKMNEAVSYAVKKGYVEIDTLILTHLHNKHSAYFEEMYSNYLVRRLIIPLPRNETERSVATSLKILADEKNVEIYTYVDNVALDIYGTKIECEHAFIKRSTHPVIKIEIYDEKSVLYVGSSYAEYGEIGDAEIIIAGKHGPVCKKEFVISSNEAELISVADEDIYSYAKIRTFSKTKLLKNTERFSLVFQ